MGFRRWYKRQNMYVKWGLKGILVNFILAWIIGFLPYSLSENSFLIYIIIFLHHIPTFFADIMGFCSGEGCVLFIITSDPIWTILIGFLGGVITKFIIDKFKKK